MITEAEAAARRWSGIELVMAAVEAAPEHPFTLDELAGIAHYSRFYFCRAFRRYSASLRPPHFAAGGMSPWEYVRAVRMRRAQELLTGTDLPVTEITFLAGYTAIGTFSTKFSEAVGVAPSVYRTRCGAAGTVPADRGLVGSVAA